MAVPNTFVAPPRVKREAIVPPRGIRTHRLFELVGVTLAIVGFFDLVLAWYPVGIGNPEWEFGTITATLNGLPLAAVGLALALVSAHEAEHLLRARAIACIFGALALLVASSAVLYVMDVPLALRAVQSNPLAHLGLTKAIIKACGLIVVYTVAFSWIAVVSWRRAVVR